MESSAFSTNNGASQSNKDEAVKQDPCCCVRGERAFKESLERIFFQTQVGRYLERLNGVLMVASTILYVVLSYLDGREGIYESDFFDKVDKVVCALLLFFYFIKFYVSQNRKQFCMQPQQFFELLVAVPVLVFVHPNLLDNYYLLIIFSRFLRLQLGATILTANQKLSSNEVTSQLYKMVINLTMLIVISALLFTGIENQ